MSCEHSQLEFHAYSFEITLVYRISQVLAHQLAGVLVSRASDTIDPVLGRSNSLDGVVFLESFSKSFYKVSQYIRP